MSKVRSDFCLPCFFQGWTKHDLHVSPPHHIQIFSYSKTLLGSGECCLQATHAGRPVISMLNSPSQGTIGCTRTSVPMVFI